MFWAALPDMHIEIVDLVAEGNMVVANCIERATFTGEFVGLPPTGMSYQKRVSTAE